ncbi:hypothetical protein ACNO7T_20975 [Vibrio campbellii]
MNHELRNKLLTPVLYSYEGVSEIIKHHAQDDSLLQKVLSKGVESLTPEEVSTVLTVFSLHHSKLLQFEDSVQKAMKYLVADEEAMKTLSDIKASYTDFLPMLNHIFTLAKKQSVKEGV